MANGAIDERVERFRADLRTHTPGEVFARHIRGQSCYALESDEEEAITRRICDKFGVAPTDVVIVGSAKLGFTLVKKTKKDRPIRPPYSPFSDESDVDVAIVSAELFDKYWKFAYGYHRSGILWDTKNWFNGYLLRGWIVPPLLPMPSPDSPAGEWGSFLNSLLRTGECGDYPVKAGIYRDNHFFETYHCDTIATLAAEENR